MEHKKSKPSEEEVNIFRKVAENENADSLSPLNDTNK